MILKPSRPVPLAWTGQRISPSRTEKRSGHLLTARVSRVDAARKVLIMMRTFSINRLTTGVATADARCTTAVVTWRRHPEGDVTMSMTDDEREVAAMTAQIRGALDAVLRQHVQALA